MFGWILRSRRWVIDFIARVTRITGKGETHCVRYLTLKASLYWRKLCPIALFTHNLWDSLNVFSTVVIIYRKDFDVSSFELIFFLKLFVYYNSRRIFSPFEKILWSDSIMHNFFKYNRYLCFPSILLFESF